MDDEYETNNTKMYDENEAKKIETSLDNLNFDIMNYYSKQRKSSDEMMNEYKNYFNIKSNKVFSDYLKKKTPGKKSVVYNNNDIFRFSNLNLEKKELKSILTTTTYPKNKKVIINNYSNNLEEIFSKNNIETESKNNNGNSEVMSCKNLLNQLVYVKKGDVVNKNKSNLIISKDIENNEEKKVVPRLNLLTKLVKKPRNSEYKKIVKFKANDDIENFNKAKCRHRSVKKKNS